MISFFIYTMGCKVNNCDSIEFSNALLAHGFEISDLKNADVIIVNSCAVTSESVRKTRQHIGRFRKENKGAFIVLTGCAYVLDEFKENKFLNLVIDRKDLVDSLLKKFEFEEIHKKERIFGEKTRAFIKIEDGCENFCSYCIIPFTRGRIKSKTIEEIDHELKFFHEASFKEVVLTGINLGRYGEDINLNIINAVAEASKYFKRIRLSSLEPDTVNEKLIDNLASFGAICPNFHLSLQSGSNKILKAMNRRYDSEFYLKIIEKFREKFKNATFTTDIIVGFPGENENDFNETLNIIKKVSFIKVNVFPFSPRPFTYAEKLKQIDPFLKKERVKKAIEFSKLVSESEISKFAGKEFEILFEYKNSENIYEGYSENYIRVKQISQDNLCGKIRRVIFSPEIS